MPYHNPQAIWKFAISIKGEDDFEIEMPPVVKILHVGVQNDIPYIWALVKHESPPVRRKFSMRGTGHSCDDINIIKQDDTPTPAEYVGTFMMYGGRLVLHLFDLGDA